MMANDVGAISLSLSLLCFAAPSAAQESFLETTERLDNFGFGGGVRVFSVPDPIAGIPDEMREIFETRPGAPQARAQLRTPCEVIRVYVMLLEDQFAVCNFSNVNKSFSATLADGQKAAEYVLTPGQMVVLQAAPKFSAVATVKRDGAADGSYLLPSKGFYTLELQAGVWVIGQPQQVAAGAQR